MTSATSKYKPTYIWCTLCRAQIKTNIQDHWNIRHPEHPITNEHEEITS